MNEIFVTNVEFVESISFYNFILFTILTTYCHDVSLLNRLDKKRSSVTMSAALTNCLKL